MPQGSIMGSTLWNAILVTTHIAEMLERTANPALRMVSEWMEAYGISITPHYSEAVILTKKWVYTRPTLHVQCHVIPVVQTAKYLSVIVNRRRPYARHTETVSERAARP